MGSLDTIDKWLERAEGISDTIIDAVGADLGTFLADLHLSTTSRNREYLAAQFKNDDAQDVVYTQVVQPVLGILDEYMVPNANQVYEIIEKEFRVVPQLHEMIFNLGDLWSGSIMVSQTGSLVGVIDWEFAGLARPSQDIGQFGFLELRYWTDFSGTFALQNPYEPRLLRQVSTFLNSSIRLV